MSEAMVLVEVLTFSCANTASQSTLPKGVQDWSVTHFLIESLYHLTVYAQDIRVSR